MVTFAPGTTPTPNGTTYHWNYGGGAEPNEADGREVTVTLVEGVWQACLTVNNTFDEHTVQWDLRVTDAPIILGVTPTFANPGSQEQFVVEWTGSRTGGTFFWNFDVDEDGRSAAIPATSEEESPQVTITQEIGTYPCSVTITNPSGSDAFNFTVRVNNPPVVEAVIPEYRHFPRGNQVYWNVRLAPGSGTPRTWTWNFGGGGNPDSFSGDYDPGNGVSVNHPTAGSFTGSVKLANEFGESEPMQFQYYVHLNKIILHPEPYSFIYDPQTQSFNPIIVRVIAVDNAFQMTYMTKVTIVYDYFLKYDRDSSFDGGEIDGDDNPGWNPPTDADGFWNLFDWDALDDDPPRVDRWMIPTSLFGPFIKDFEILDPRPIVDNYFNKEDALYLYIACDISPVYHPDYQPFRAPVGSGLSLSDYQQGNFAPTTGDLFNFRIEINNEVSLEHLPEFARLRFVLRKENDPEYKLLTYYGANAIDYYEWDIVQDESISGYERYHLKIPIIVGTP